MTETPDRLDATRLTLSILLERGWAALWSNDSHGPLNIRSAASKACTRLVGNADALTWTDLYLDVVHAIGTHLKAGITDWENGVRNKATVYAMLNDVVHRLENDDISRRPARPQSRGL